MNRSEECHLEWEEPVVIELSKDPDAEGVCAAVGSGAVGGCAPAGAVP